MTVCLGFENCSCHHMWLFDFRAERRHLDYVLLRDLHFLVWCVLLYFEAKRTLLTTLFTTIFVYTVNRASSWNSHRTSTNQHSNYIVSANVQVSLSAGIHIKIFTFKFHCRKKRKIFQDFQTYHLEVPEVFMWGKQLSFNCSLRISFT